MADHRGDAVDVVRQRVQFVFAACEKARAQQQVFRGITAQGLFRKRDQRCVLCPRFVRERAHPRGVRRQRADGKIVLRQREPQHGHVFGLRKSKGRDESRPRIVSDCGARVQCFIFVASVLPRSAGDFTVVTPAFSSAANLAAAVPLPPEMIAPAWPMRLPAGADAPAMNATTGLVTFSAMNSAASSSALPPISPTMMMPCVCGSPWNRRRQSMKFIPLIGSPPMPMQVLWPSPAWVVWNTAS